MACQVPIFKSTRGRYIHARAANVSLARGGELGRNGSEGTYF